MESAYEHILTHAYKPAMLTFMEEHPECFEEAVALAVTDTQPYSWRSAWLLGDCIAENDARLRPHVRAIVEAIPGKRDGHQRELLKLLLRMEIHEDLEGRVFDACASLWEDIANAPSVRITALKYMLRMAEKYPELRNEITALAREHYMDTLSPGARRSAQRMLGTLHRRTDG